MRAFMVSGNEGLSTMLKKFAGLLIGGATLSVLLLISNVARAANLPYPLAQVTKNAGLIFSGRKDYAKYELVVGKMEYVEDADNEGFKPAAKQLLVGAVDRRLYDYAKQKSAIEIYKKMLASLEQQQYRVVYKCSGDDCGGAAGWRLFLSDKLGGDTGFQHYLVATQGGASDASRYVVLYVNDLAGQPRALVDVVTVSKASLQRSVKTTAAAGLNREGRRASIYFDLGQSALADRAEQLAHAKRFVEAHRADCPIRVIGYTDAIGGEAANQTLAKARVDAVIHYLQDIQELKPDCLVPDPRGIEMPAVSHDRKMSRRVDLELASRN